MMGTTEVRSMPSVIIYTKDYCPYCHKAKALLNKKGVPFTEHDVENDAAGFAKMVTLSGGRRTVPQVFIGQKHVGGCDDLHAADDRGDLDRWLAA
jgi:glutaredoxin 3